MSNEDLNGVIRCMFTCHKKDRSMYTSRILSVLQSLSSLTTLQLATENRSDDKLDNNDVISAIEFFCTNLSKHLKSGVSSSFTDSELKTLLKVMQVISQHACHIDMHINVTSVFSVLIDTFLSSSSKYCSDVMKNIEILLSSESLFCDSSCLFNLLTCKNEKLAAYVPVHLLLKRCELYSDVEPIYIYNWIKEFFQPNELEEHAKNLHDVPCLKSGRMILGFRSFTFNIFVTEREHREFLETVYNFFGFWMTNWDSLPHNKLHFNAQTTANIISTENSCLKYLFTLPSFINVDLFCYSKFMPPGMWKTSISDESKICDSRMLYDNFNPYYVWLQTTSHYFHDSCAQTQILLIFIHYTEFHFQHASRESDRCVKNLLQFSHGQLVNLSSRLKYNTKYNSSYEILESNWLLFTLVASATRYTFKRREQLKEFLSEFFNSDGSENTCVCEFFLGIFGTGLSNVSRSFMWPILTSTLLLFSESEFEANVLFTMDIFTKFCQPSSHEMNLEFSLITLMSYLSLLKVNKIVVKLKKIMVLCADNFQEFSSLYNASSAKSMCFSFQKSKLHLVEQLFFVNLFLLGECAAMDKNVYFQDENDWNISLGKLYDNLHAKYRESHSYLKITHIFALKQLDFALISNTRKITYTCERMSMYKSFTLHLAMAVIEDQNFTGTDDIVLLALIWVLQNSMEICFKSMQSRSQEQKMLASMMKLLSELPYLTLIKSCDFNSQSILCACAYLIAFSKLSESASVNYHLIDKFLISLFTGSVETGENHGKKLKVSSSSNELKIVVLQCLNYCGKLDFLNLNSASIGGIVQACAMRFSPWKESLSNNEINNTNFMHELESINDEFENQPNSLSADSIYDSHLSKYKIKILERADHFQQILKYSLVFEDKVVLKSSVKGLIQSATVLRIPPCERHSEIKWLLLTIKSFSVACSEYGTSQDDTNQLILLFLNCLKESFKLAFMRESLQHIHLLLCALLSLSNLLCHYYCSSSNKSFILSMGTFKSACNNVRSLTIIVASALLQQFRHTEIKYLSSSFINVFILLNQIWLNVTFEGITSEQPKTHFFMLDNLSKTIFIPKTKRVIFSHYCNFLQNYSCLTKSYRINRLTVIKQFLSKLKIPCIMEQICSDSDVCFAYDEALQFFEFLFDNVCDSTLKSLDLITDLILLSFVWCNKHSHHAVKIRKFFIEKICFGEECKWKLLLGFVIDKVLLGFSLFTEDSNFEETNFSLFDAQSFNDLIILYPQQILRLGQTAPNPDIYLHPFFDRQKLISDVDIAKTVSLALTICAGKELCEDDLNTIQLSISQSKNVLKTSCNVISVLRVCIFKSDILHENLGSLLSGVYKNNWKPSSLLNVFQDWTSEQLSKTERLQFLHDMLRLGCEFFSSDVYSLYLTGDAIQIQRYLSWIHVNIFTSSYIVPCYNGSQITFVHFHILSGLGDIIEDFILYSKDTCINYDNTSLLLNKSNELLDSILSFPCLSISGYNYSSLIPPLSFLNRVLCELSLQVILNNTLDEKLKTLLYDSFEKVRKLSGKELSPIVLTLDLIDLRFPLLSKEQKLMVHDFFICEDTSINHNLESKIKSFCSTCDVFNFYKSLDYQAWNLYDISMHFDAESQNKENLLLSEVMNLFLNFLITIIKSENTNDDISQLNDLDTKKSAIFCYSKIRNFMESNNTKIFQICADECIRTYQLYPIMLQKFVLLLSILQKSDKPTRKDSGDALLSLNNICVKRKSVTIQLALSQSDIRKNTYLKNVLIRLDGMTLDPSPKDKVMKACDRIISCRIIEKIQNKAVTMNTKEDIIAYFEWLRRSDYISDSYIQDVYPVISKDVYLLSKFIPCVLLDAHEGLKTELSGSDEACLLHGFQKVVETSLNSADDIVRKIGVNLLVLLHRTNQFRIRDNKKSFFIDKAVNWLMVSQKFCVNSTLIDSALLYFENFWLNQTNEDELSIFSSANVLETWVGLCEETNDEDGFMAANLFVIGNELSEAKRSIEALKLIKQSKLKALREAQNRHMWRLRIWDHSAIMHPFKDPSTLTDENLEQFLLASGTALHDEDMITFNEQMNYLASCMQHSLHKNMKLLSSDVLTPLSIMVELQHLSLTKNLPDLQSVVQSYQGSNMSMEMMKTMFQFTCIIHKLMGGDGCNRICAMYDFREKFEDLQLSIDTDYHLVEDSVSGMCVELKRRLFLIDDESEERNVRIENAVLRNSWAKCKQFLTTLKINVSMNQNLRDLDECAGSFIKNVHRLTNCLHDNCFATEKEIVSTIIEPSLNVINKVKVQYENVDFDCEKINKSIADGIYMIAKFADLQYEQIVSYLKSNEFKQREKLLKQAEADSKCLRELGEKNHLQRLLERQWAFEQKELSNILEEARIYKQMAAKHYCLSLTSGTKHDLCIYRLIYLWLFANAELESVRPDLELSINEFLNPFIISINCRKFLPIFPQLVARLEAKNSGSEAQLQRSLELLITCVIEQYTFPAIYSLMAQIHADMDESILKKMGQAKKSVFGYQGLAASGGVSGLKEQSGRTQAAMRIYKIVLASRGDEGARQRLLAAKRLCVAYIELANADVECRRGSGGGPFPMDSAWALVQLSKEKTLRCLPLPTVTQGHATTQPITIHSFQETYNLAGGLNLPKILVCIGSDGRKRRQVVKGRDDLRQDAVMQQIFEISNLLFSDWQSSHNDGSKSYEKRRKYAGLHINTYSILPMSRRSGVLEWCEGTQPLGEWLAGDASRNAHVRYRPRDMTPAAAKQSLAGVRDKPPSRRQPVYTQICSRLGPVLGHFFVECFERPADWVIAKRSYTKSLAVASILGYVVGLGDRHPQNILLHKVTGEVVHIDLGIAFEQGRLLPTPEMVPFRLTRDMVHGLGPFGLQASFRPCAELALAILCDQEGIITTLMQVLLHDPLYAWCLTPSQLCALEARRIELAGDLTKSPAAANTASSLLQPSVGVKAITTSTSLLRPGESMNQLAERALLNVRRKLSGESSTRQHHQQTSCHVAGRIEKLIAEATSPQNLSKMYFGWQAYL